jgi:L-ascorbate metabolism protein UlaG (beta-lactamase superfamily)
VFFDILSHMVLIVTKLVHSCLLVEKDGQTILMDPGNYSYAAEFFDTNNLEKLDAIVITHEHDDHAHIPFIQEILQTFPNTPIISNTSVKNLLGKENIEVFDTVPEGVPVEMFNVPHEALTPLGETPPNTGMHIFGSLTHPGDSHQFTESKDVLALPITAPWGALTKAVETALRAKPRFIIPIHDWHYNDTAREQTYSQLESFFKNHDITFVPLQDGNPLDIDASS